MALLPLGRESKQPARKPALRAALREALPSSLAPLDAEARTPTAEVLRHPPACLP